MVGINESTGRYVHKNEKAICAAFTACAPLTTKVVSQVREKVIIKMENALYIRRFKQANPSTSTHSTFVVSKGWFDHFSFRFSLRNVKVSEEAASADLFIASSYPEELKQLIEEKRFCPEQIFNADESAFFWKKMASRTFSAKELHYISEFKARKSMARLVAARDDDSHLEVDRGGFKDMQELEAIELIESHISELTDEEPVEMIASIDEEKDADEEGATDETEKLTLEGLAEILHALKQVAERIFETDSDMVQVIKFKRDLEIAAKPYQRILDKMNKRKKQLSITMFFKNNAPDSPSISGDFACKNTPTIWTVIHSTK
ncbi:Tigger transposable element-derived protein 1 [Trichinella papuae]|uniref:Tigger transposable element-derived protein 1 n=1 Tax=Trichinella papuae TaxID=268474 RepID=A0A0V1NAG5_9BILA|nr:Tigger transposable element-derived protein 1 [Trichinella papuae]